MAILNYGYNYVIYTEWITLIAVVAILNYDPGWIMLIATVVVILSYGYSCDIYMMDI